MLDEEDPLCELVGDGVGGGVMVSVAVPLPLCVNVVECDTTSEKVRNAVTVGVWYGLRVSVDVFERVKEAVMFDMETLNEAVVEATTEGLPVELKLSEAVRDLLTVPLRLSDGVWLEL